MKQAQPQATTSNKVDAPDDALFETMVSEFRQAAGGGGLNATP